MKNQSDVSSCIIRGLAADGFHEDGSEVEFPTSRVASPQMPHVLNVQWDPSDHIAKLYSMLQGVTAEHVESKLVQYVEENIEPAGWRAVWRVPANLSDSLFILKQETCVYVDVINVSQEKLLADVKVLEPVEGSILWEDLKLIEEAKNRMVQVPLMELSVLADQENEALDMVNTAEVICQIKFFYEHIWQPWDLEEENLYFSHNLISARLKLYQDLQTGHFPTAVGTHLRGIIREANIIQKEIQIIESLSEEESVDFEIDQKHVARLFKLHHQLEKLKTRFDMLKDPVLRELSVLQSQEDEVMSTKMPHAKVKVVAHTLTTEQLVMYMAMVPNLIKSLPHVPDDALWQTSSSLQSAINAAHEEDVIVLFPGKHTLCQLGFSFARSGTIVGLGDGVVVEGRSEDGDVMMDVMGNFTFQNIIMKPATKQIGIVQHGGLLTLQNVTVKGGRWGLLVLGNTEACISHVYVEGCNAGGMDFRDGATAVVSASSIKDCKIGIQLEKGAKISLSGTSIEGNKKYGVLMLSSEEEASKCQDMSSDTLLECFLEKGTGNTVKENSEADVAVSAGVPSSFINACGDNLASSPVSVGGQIHNSEGSLDSGCEFIEATID